VTTPRKEYVLDCDGALAKQPSHVAFNGHTQALTKTPLVANTCERVRIYFNNVGPSDGSSFHVVGAIFDRVFHEGNPRNDWAGLPFITGDACRCSPICKIWKWRPLTCFWSTTRRRQEIPRVGEPGSSWAFPDSRQGSLSRLRI
jgi:hypothetical protein